MDDNFELKYYRTKSVLEEVIGIAHKLSGRPYSRRECDALNNRLYEIEDSLKVSIEL